MSLNFPNVSVLGLSQDSRFFEAGFNYSSLRRISIEGLVTNLIQTDGITGLWTGTNGVINTIYNNQDYQDLYLNGYSFGSGRIESISFSEGNDVRTKSFSASLLVYDTGNTFNLTGYYYSGIDISNFKYLDKFSEDYSFNKKLNGGYSYDHSMSVKFVSGDRNLNAIAAAQSLAKTIFTGSNLGLNFYSGYTNKQGKRYIRESYNVINNECYFTERFDFDVNLGNYSAIQTNSASLDDNGVITVVEKGVLRGIENPNYQNAIAALGSQISGSYYRCSGVQSFYFASGYTLNSYPLTQERILDIYGNRLEYVISFNNNPNNSGTYFWDYTQQSSLENGITNIVEQGTIAGRGENRSLAFSAAQNGYSGIIVNISGRINNNFSNQLFSVPAFQLNRKETYSPYNGLINYNYVYSNNPNLVSNTGIRWIQVSENDKMAIYKLNHLNIFNNKEIIQDDKQSVQGSSLISLNMKGDRSATLQTFLSSAQTILTSKVPSGINIYIGDCNYNYSPNENILNVSLEWKYNNYYGRTIYPI
jgi:hypothetical protein